MRKASLDVCRVLACMAVVLGHSGMLFWDFDPSAPVWAAYNLLFVILRSSVLLQKVIMSGLAIVLGTFGVHKFFQGKTKWGMAYLFLFWTMIPTLVSIVEGIRYLFMPVDDFYNQYYR